MRRGITALYKPRCYDILLPTVPPTVHSHYVRLSCTGSTKMMETPIFFLHFEKKHRDDLSCNKSDNFLETNCFLSAVSSFS